MRWMKRLCLAVACLLLAVPAGPALAQSAEPITYTLRFPAPHTHYVSVEASVPTGGRPQIELMMAVWTPGSYLVREYARHVEDVVSVAADGKTTIWSSSQGQFMVRAMTSMLPMLALLAVMPSLAMAKDQVYATSKSVDNQPAVTQDLAKAYAIT